MSLAHPADHAAYVLGESYTPVCAAGHSGTYDGLTNGHLTFICNGGCGNQFRPYVSKVADAREHRDTAARMLERAIVGDYKQGRPLSRIADDAGMSRQAVYDLLDRHGAR